MEDTNQHLQASADLVLQRCTTSGQSADLSAAADVITKAPRGNTTMSTVDAVGLTKPGWQCKCAPVVVPACPAASAPDGQLLAHRKPH